MGKRLTRRDFLKLSLRGAIHFVLMSAGGAGYGMLIEPGLFKVERVELKLKRLSEAFSGFRFAQISDIHMGGWMNVERLQHVADIIRAEKPDVLLITGDFIMGHYFTERSKQYLRDTIEALSPLAAAVPTYAVLGNHDYWANAEAVRQVLSTCGITDLTNTVFTITRGDDKLHLCGVDDVWEGKVRLKDVIAQLNDTSAAILLAHEPDYADTSSVTGKFDLQVSGHTHGGQIVLPFFGAPILPYLGWKYPSGLYQIGEMYQYTNRGVGMVRFPVRINCPPEITLFTLERPAS
jgi:predicted MPP superfamily phosphohydrolase